MAQHHHHEQKGAALRDAAQEQLTQSIKAFQENQIGTLKARDLEAVEQAKATGNITVHNWSEEERTKFRGIATGEWEEVAAGSAMAQKVFDALTAYLTDKGLL